jgi:hypothetical protein
MHDILPCTLRFCARAMVVFAFMISWPLVNWAVAQESKIEDRISEEIAARKDVWPIVQKLRILRKNESQLGEKHPRMAATRDQIATLEKQLSELINPTAANPNQTVPTYGANLSESSNRIESKKPGPNDPPSNMQSTAGPNTQTQPLFNNNSRLTRYNELRDSLTRNRGIGSCLQGLKLPRFDACWSVSCPRANVGNRKR